MDGLTTEDLRKRHADLVAAREAHQRQAHETDLGFAYALGEVEGLIALVEQRQATMGDAAARELDLAFMIAEEAEPAPVCSGDALEEHGT